jgi:LPS-assembly protein
LKGSDRTEDIPNRDAADFRLDEANMFLANRFQGRDFILPGSHVAAGVSGITESSFLGDVSGFIGLSYRTSGTPAASIST